MATLGVEDGNHRARRLYEWLGYTEYGRRPDGWDQLDADGNVVRYETELVTKQKHFAP